MVPNNEKKKLLCESVFVHIEGGTLFLKMEKSEAFLMKPKHQFHLP